MKNHFYHGDKVQLVSEKRKLLAPTHFIVVRHVHSIAVNSIKLSTLLGQPIVYVKRQQRPLNEGSYVFENDLEIIAN